MLALWCWTAATQRTVLYSSTRRPQNLFCQHNRVTSTRHVERSAYSKFIALLDGLCRGRVALACKIEVQIWAKWQAKCSSSMGNVKRTNEKNNCLTGSNIQTIGNMLWIRMQSTLSSSSGHLPSYYVLWVTSAFASVLGTESVFLIGRLSFQPIPRGTALSGHVTSGTIYMADNQVTG